jgi:hypothetical protein
LHRISINTPGRDFVLRAYDYSDLSDRLDLLAILYHDVGDVRKAIRVLKESGGYASGMASTLMARICCGIISPNWREVADRGQREAARGLTGASGRCIC